MDIRQAITQRILNNPDAISLQELQRAVQDGVVPAYVGVPLIQDKVQRAKQSQNMQAAQTTQQQPQQPPIAQQVMAEAQGIEGLPTALPAKMAGGGIIAFDEGGDVPRYQTGGGLYDLNRDPLVNAIRNALPVSMAYGDPSGMGGTDITGAAGTVAPYVGPSLLERIVSAPQMPEWQKQQKIQQIMQERAAVAAPPTSVSPTSAPAPAPAPATTPTAAPQAGTGGIGQLASSLGINLGGSSRTPGIGLQPSTPNAPPYQQSAMDVLNKQLYGTETEPGYFGRSEARETALNKKIAEAEGKITGKAYEGLEKDLRKEEEQLGVDKQEAKYMAMFKAGLAMMGGDSRFALQNIGKGATVGLEDYQAAAKDIKKAHKENQKMLANIEQARRAEDIGDRDRAIGYAKDALKSAEERDKLGVNAIMSATNTDATRALDIWKTQTQTQTSRDVANISGQYSLAGHELSGKYSLLGHALSAMGKDRMTPYQETRLRMEAEKQVDPNASRMELAKSLNLSSVPKPGADKTFDQKAKELHDRKVYEYIYGSVPSGGAAANSYAGFKLVP